MLTNLELSDRLIQEAMTVTQIKNAKKVITLALEELIKKSKITDLKQYQGISLCNILHPK